MKQQIPINTASDNTAFTVTARYGAMCDTNLQGGGHYPMTAILEIEMEEPKIIQVGNYMDDSGKGFKNPQCGRVYSPDGIAPTLNTCGGGQREPKIIQIGSYSPSSACNAVVLKCRIRKLTPREVYRLQDVDDADIDKLFAYRIKTTLKNGTVKEKPIPKSRHYALAGNSITVSPLYFIFKAMFIDEPPEPKPQQLSPFD